MSLLINSLCLWYGERQTLYNIDIAVNKGELTALLGPSGCGKSTLLRTVNHMHPREESIKTTGSIVLNGDNLLSTANTLTKGQKLPQLRKKVGMVFQAPAPFPMSIYKNVAYGIRLHNQISKAALNQQVEAALIKAALFDEVKDRLSSPALALSGGQQQRLCIARALAVEPLVLLLDEPTSALDPLSTYKIEELLTKLKSRYLILMVTHNVAQATRIADRCAVMWQGEIIEQGYTHRVLTLPTDSRVKSFLGGI